ncbi:hypothetical protein BDP27DRAFT_1005696 [Rhodocollybia butyracea]|uniref:Uncharacterized protein n=1 Tax=Rhodocollybia butyracea TaxID=206335 RepID=A0A9P5PNT0_9AGAR|nr:hypothetical protein BDP27DRAFT_1005696 [Rhodocollybia butyracea]
MQIGPSSRCAWSWRISSAKGVNVSCTKINKIAFGRLFEGTRVPRNCFSTFAIHLYCSRFTAMKTSQSALVGFVLRVDGSITWAGYLSFFQPVVYTRSSRLNIRYTYKQAGVIKALYLHPNIYVSLSPWHAALFAGRAHRSVAAWGRVLPCRTPPG